jgi:hypothetical protein
MEKNAWIDAFSRKGLGETGVAGVFFFPGRVEINPGWLPANAR